MNETTVAETLDVAGIWAHRRNRGARRAADQEISIDGMCGVY
jgi:hypothetical protein